MKQQYEKMELYKIDFNANEQVSAACSIYFRQDSTRYVVVDVSDNVCLMEGSDTGHTVMYTDIPSTPTTGGGISCMTDENVNQYYS